MNDYCTHHDCRLEAVNALLWLYAEGKRTDCLDQALRLRNNPSIEVRCQRAVEGRASRSGAPNAPLPERKAGP